MFRLAQKEAKTLQASRSQFVTLKRGENVKYLPYAFTEYGALMAANIGHSRSRAPASYPHCVSAFSRGSRSRRPMAKSRSQSSASISPECRSTASYAASTRGSWRQ